MFTCKTEGYLRKLAIEVQVRARRFSLDILSLRRYRSNSSQTKSLFYFSDKEEDKTGGTTLPKSRPSCREWVVLLLEYGIGISSSKRNQTSPIVNSYFIS